MKTKFNKYITLALLFVLSVSCSDNFLEEKKQYGLYDDTFFQSKERVDWFVNNMYYDYFAAFKSPITTLIGSYKDTYSKMTEELGGIQDFINPNKTFINSSDGNGYYGVKPTTSLINNPYTRIRECNIILTDLDVKGASLDKTYRDQVKGQMYYLRAIQYFDLMRVYGGVPIVTTVEDASAVDPTIKLPRASVAEVVAQITKDLDLAASLLPGKWDLSNYGRFTRGAALAQKSRVLLTYASPLFNKNWDSSTDRWDAALKAGLDAETQLTIDGYGLFGNTAKDWEKMFVTANNGFCSEAITVQLLSAKTLTTGIINSSWEQGIRLLSQGGTSALEAPKEMIDLFPLSDGRKPTVANGYNDFLFFVDRDPRFYRTFAFSGAKWGYKEDPNSVAWSYRWMGLDKGTEKAYFSGNNQENSPAYVRKMSDVTASNASSFMYSGTDIYEYRYAELLLNIAECYAAKGEGNNALAYLGKIRKRVGISSANNYGIGTLADKYAAISACLYERRVELAYEGKRYWDVQRWMLYSDESLPNVANTTCAKLGLTPINGTQRTGNYLQYKSTVTSADPLLAARAGISVDPDASDFQAQLAMLANFYTSNFTLVKLDTPMDNSNGTAVKIKFNPNYYIMGFDTTTLTQNAWLPQTLGWNDAYGSAGTFNYQD